MKRLFDLPPVAPEVGVHPRVMVVSKDLKRIKENLNHLENIKMYEYVEKISTFKTDGVLPDTKEYQNTNENDEIVGCMEANAFLYLINKDRKNGEKAILLAKNYLQTLNIKDGIDNITRHSGYLIYVASCVYDWCYELLSDDDKAIFKENMLKHAAKTEIGWPPVREYDTTGHSCEAQTFRDILSMGIALYDEDPEIYNLIAGRIYHKMLKVRNYAYNAKMFVEGTDYGPFRYPAEMFSTILFDKIGLKGIYDRNQLYVLYGTIYDRLPDGRFINTGDCSSSPGFGHYDNGKCSYFLAGNYYKDPYIRKLYFKSNESGVNTAIGRYGISAPVHLIVNDPTVGIKSYKGFPLMSFFNEPLANMVCRTSWDEGRDTQSVVVKLNGGARTFLNHQHLDSGHFDIYYKGKLALDSGMYQSSPFMRDNKQVKSLKYGSLHDINYHKRTIAHNCMLVFDPNEELNYNDSTVIDGGQKGGAGVIPERFEDLMQDGNIQGKMLEYSFKDGNYGYLKSDLTSAYTSKVEHYERTFVFLEFPTGEYKAALIVFDDITAKNLEFKKTYLLHTQNQPKIDGNKTTVVSSFNGRMINETIFPKDSILTLVGGKDREFEVNGYNEKAVPKTDYHEAGKWRLEVSPANANKQDYFLNVMLISDNDDKILPIDTKVIENNDCQITLNVNGRIVSIGKNNEDSFIDGFNVSKKPMEQAIVDDCYEPIDVRIGLGFETFKNKPFTDGPNLFLPMDEYFKKINYDGNLPQCNIIKENGVIYISPVEIAKELGTEVKWDNNSKCCFIKIVDKPSFYTNVKMFDPEDDSKFPTDMVEFSSCVETDDTTYWSAYGDNEWIVFESFYVEKVSSFEFYWKDGNKKKQKFEIEISIDGKNYINVYSGESNGCTLGFEKVELGKTFEGKFVRIICHGTDMDNFNSLKEVYIYK